MVGGIQIGGGSSPRVRGTVRNSRSSNRRPRFIPARAGNGLPSDQPRAKSSVHPRACGERGFSSAIAWRNAGSSPRVRGTGGLQHRLAAYDRFIPARAGNGFVFASLLTSTSVHPRACGERCVESRYKIAANGSSPRVRGTGALRISFASNPAVHPRACGERRASARRRSYGSGSSPRVRGTVTHPAT